MPNQNKNKTNAKDPAVEALLDAIRDNLTPYAVAAIACILQSGAVCLDDSRESVREQVDWFSRALVETLGRNEFRRLVDELHI